jgi:hypothetical protein
MTTLDTVLNGLMSRYKARVPDVALIVNAMMEKGLIADASEIQNDHIAFRTMGVKNLGIQSLEKIFLAYGYQKRDAYVFDKKKLDAFWYSPPDPQYPRIFISELRVSDLSANVQKIIYSYTDTLTEDPVNALTLRHGESVDTFLHSPLWRTPTWEDFKTVRSESEYGAWVLYNRYYLNHFTLSVHELPDAFNTIDKFNKFVESLGVVLNNSNGKVKTSKDGKLIQSSTVSKSIKATFPHQDGSEHTHNISGSYVEFAERKILDDGDARRDGFDSGNADTIFESTYTNQTKREQ